MNQKAKIGDTVIINAACEDKSLRGYIGVVKDMGTERCFIEIGSKGIYQIHFNDVEVLQTTSKNDITKHSGNKYIRSIKSCIDDKTIDVDVYAVLVAFNVTNPAVAHAVKKLLCTGVRGKATAEQDLKESIDAISRAIEII